MFGKKTAVQEDKKTGGCGCNETTTIKPAKGSSFKSSRTQIKVKYDIGFNNTLYIRGKGANLSWEHGIPMQNVKADEWVWETDAQFNSLEFKVLINDRIYEAGNNHTIQSGSSTQYTPQF